MTGSDPTTEPGIVRHLSAGVRQRRRWRWAARADARERALFPLSSGFVRPYRGCWQLRRIRATSNKSRDIPPVNMGHSVDEFFDVLAEDSNAGAKLPNWSVDPIALTRTALKHVFSRSAGAANCISRCVRAMSQLWLVLMQRVQFHRGTYTSHGTCSSGMAAMLAKQSCRLDQEGQPQV